MNYNTIKQGLFFFVLIVYTASYGQAGLLDNSFYWTGYVHSDFNDSSNNVVDKILIQPDNKIVLVGHNYPTQYFENFAVARYQAGGAPDLSFGNGGEVLITGGRSQYWYYIMGALQTDGKIVLSASFLNADSNYDFVLMRLNINGSIDSSFGNSGKVITNIGGRQDIAWFVGIQPDGSIIQAGESTPSRGWGITSVASIRVKPNGVIDSTYGINGIVDSTIIGSCNAFELLPNGKLLAAGDKLLRLNSDGTRDNTFNPSNFPFIRNSYNIIYSIATQGDGKIIVGFDTLLRVNGQIRNPVIMRLTQDGYVDSTFNQTGHTVTDFDYDAIPLSIVVQPDNKAVVLNYLGFSRFGTITPAISIVRYFSDGQIDWAFGGFGYFFLDTFITSYGYGQAVSLQADGKIIGAGKGRFFGRDRFLAVRLTTDLHLGILDFEAGEVSPLVYPNPIQKQTTLEYELLKTECITIGLYDLQGRLVQAIAPSQSKTKGIYRESILIPSTLAKGTYLIKISNGNNTTAVRVVVGN